MLRSGAGILGILVGVIIIDGMIIFRRKTLRLNGRALAHTLFLMGIILLIILSSQGAICLDKLLFCGRIELMPNPEFGPRPSERDTNPGKTKERFHLVPTYLPGISLRVEPEIELDILQRTIKNFYELAKQFAEVKFQIDDLDTQQVPRREEIIGVAKENEGLRGLTSVEDNFVLTVAPRTKTIWNRDLLKESMGIAYSAVTREDLAVNVSVPVGFLTEKGIVISEEVMTKALAEALANLGISKEDLAKVMRQEVNISLDEEKVTEMVNQGRVELLEGAKTSEITWAVRVDRLKK